MSQDRSDFAVADLYELANLYGVATEYWDYSGCRQEVSQDTLRSVLSALGVDCSDPDRLRGEIERWHDDFWRRPLPASVVAREDQDYWVKVHLPHGEQLRVEICYEDGEVAELAQIDNWVEPRWVDGQLIGQATFLLPAGTRTGWHLIKAHYLGETFSTVAAVTPASLPQPQLRDERAWGVMHQFYAGLSAKSWGIGDAADLAQLAQWAGQAGADFTLINPVHASQPVLPLEDSPYLPCSRRFWNPIYIRPNLIEEAATLTGEKLERFQWLEQQSQLSAADRDPAVVAVVPDPAKTNRLDPVSAPFYQGKLIDRNWSWFHKLQALELVYQQPRSAQRQIAFDDFLHEQGEELAKFALWCALVEKVGFPLPAEYQSIESPALMEIAPELSDRQDFYCWVQWIIFQQLQLAHHAARAAGMRLGIMHDLAVGIHGHGADLWANPSHFVSQVEVGAPADMYNQLGQNWSQPPWHPQSLEDSAYQPLRDVVRAAASMGGALRIDHIMGLFRLWWIPKGHLPKDGTYVRYNHEAMVGVLLLECARQGVQVVGEDLGTVEPWVREYLQDRGILGTGVLWFENDGADLLAPEKYRSTQLVAANTHDMPPSAGYWANEDLRVRKALSLLDIPAAEAEAHNAYLRTQMRHLLAEYADLPNDLATGAVVQGDGSLLSSPLDSAFWSHWDYEISELIKSQYRFLTRTPARLLVVTVADLVKQCLTQNQPGTCREYPNWRIPLSAPNGRAVLLEELFTTDFAGQLLELVEQEVHHS